MVDLIMRRRRWKQATSKEHKAAKEDSKVSFISRRKSVQSTYDSASCPRPCSRQISSGSCIHPSNLEESAILLCPPAVAKPCKPSQCQYRIILHTTLATTPHRLHYEPLSNRRRQPKSSQSINRLHHHVVLHANQCTHGTQQRRCY